MDEIKSWVLTICFAAVAAGMAGILAPSGNLEKIFKFVISLFFLACVLIPVFSMKKISISEFLPAASSCVSDSGSLQDFVTKQEIDEVKIRISNLVCSCCKEYGVNPTYVYSTVAKSSSGEISISECRVVVTQKELKKKKELEQAVKEKLGLHAVFEAKKEAK